MMDEESRRFRVIAGNYDKMTQFLMFAGNNANKMTDYILMGIALRKLPSGLCLL